MSDEPAPKKPRPKDAEYMRKAYIYSAILLVLGLIGGLLLADRILKAEREAQTPEIEEIEEVEQPDDEASPPRDSD